MDTEIIKINKIGDAADSSGESLAKDAISMAADLIRRGELVAFPTETVYGLGADATNPEASQKIYAAKGRPSDNPLIVHICDIKQLYDVAREVPDAALKLAEKFWPGPLTIILPKSDLIPKETTGGLDTVAIRMPDNEIALSLIKESGCPIAAPSANRSGRPSPTEAAHVYEDLKGRIPLILDGGAVIIGLESTIADLSTDTPAILRPGFFDENDLAAAGVRIDIRPASKISENDDTAPKAPGMKYRHYAPKARLIAIRGKADDVISMMLDLAENNASANPADAQAHIGFLCTDESKSAFRNFSANHPDTPCTIISLGSSTDAKSIASGLFAAFRSFDEAGTDVIYSEYFDESELSAAITNRLKKAAGGRIIDLNDSM